LLDKVRRKTRCAKCKLVQRNSSTSIGRRESVRRSGASRYLELDVDTRKRFKFLTNNFTLPALTIALIYKARWQVELFFKCIKQHLRIKSFYACYWAIGMDGSISERSNVDLVGTYEPRSFQFGGAAKGVKPSDLEIH